MPRYLALISFTQQGIQDAAHSIERAHAFRRLVDDAGGTVESIDWALGQFDGAVRFRAPDDATAASLLLKLGKQGFVRTNTLRIYDEDEFQTVAAQT